MQFIVVGTSAFNVADIHEVTLTVNHAVVTGSATHVTVAFNDGHAPVDFLEKDATQFLSAWHALGLPTIGSPDVK